MKAKAAEIQAVVAGFGEERVDEYRIAFTRADEPEVAHGVVWPLYGREDETANPGPLDEMMAQLIAGVSWSWRLSPFWFSPK